MTSIYKRENIVRFRAVSVNSTVNSIEFHLKNNHIKLSPDYQRDYVWTDKEQQEFLKALLSGFPVGFLALALHDTDSECFMECVDGKQRLTTLLKVFNDEILLPIGDKQYKWSELDLPSKRFIGQISLPYYEFKSRKGFEDVEYKERLDYFIAVNFAGVPQSEEHKQHVLEMRNKL